jgi:tripartite tricarboxylate transporter TctB family protein
MKKLEVLLFVILGGFAATFLFLSREYNSTAALFPKLIAIASLLFLAGGIVSQKFSNMGSDPSLLDFKPSMLALQGGYVVVIYLLGFFVATLLYLIVAPMQLRYPHRGIAVAISVVLTLLLAGSFMWLFDIQLPPGAIWEML